MISGNLRPLTHPLLFSAKISQDNASSGEILSRLSIREYCEKALPSRKGRKSVVRIVRTPILTVQDVDIMERIMRTVRKQGIVRGPPAKTTDRPRRGNRYPTVP